MSIPDKFNEEILRRTGKGQSTRQIADWLKKEHEVECTYGGVGRRLATIRQGREEVAKAVVQEELRPQVMHDLALISRHQGILDAMATRLARGMVPTKDSPDTPLLDECIGKTPRVLVYTGVVRELMAVTAKKLELSGAGGGDSERGRSGVLIMPAETDEDDL